MNTKHETQAGMRMPVGLRLAVLALTLASGAGRAGVSADYAITPAALDGGGGQHRGRLADRLLRIR